MSLDNAKLEIITISNVLEEALTNIATTQSTFKTKIQKMINDVAESLEAKNVLVIELNKAKSEILSLKLEKSTMKDDFEKIITVKLRLHYLPWQENIRKRKINL